MKRMIALLILVVGIFGCTSLESKQEQARFATEQMAWLDMCQLLVDERAGYHCARLMPPLVVYEEMREGLYGYYDGSDTIYVRSDLTGTDLFETLMHEGIHYVHVQLQILELPAPAIEVCWSENQAWMLTGAYYNEDNSNWWRAYPHCWQYYATSEELREIGYIWNTINSIIDGIIWEN